MIAKQFQLTVKMHFMQTVITHYITWIVLKARTANNVNKQFKMVMHAYFH